MQARLSKADFSDLHRKESQPNKSLDQSPMILSAIG